MAMGDSKDARISLKDTLRAQPNGSHAYGFRVPINHCYGPYAHGGFLCSVALSAVKTHFGLTLAHCDQPDTFDIHLTYLRFVKSGACEVVIEDIKIGRGTSTVGFTLSQKGTKCVTGFASNMNMDKEQGSSYPTTFQLHNPPPPVAFEDLLQDANPHWVSFVFPYTERSFLKGATDLRWFTPTKSGDDPSIVDFWFTPLADDGTFITEMVGSIADQWGSSSDNFHPGGLWTTAYMAAGTKSKDPNMGTDLSKMPIGFATFSTSMHIRKRLPAEGVKWLFVRAQMKKIENGRLDSELLVFDAEMDLVAVSQQVNIFADGRRFQSKSTKL